MSCRGVLFSLDDKQVKKLKKVKRDDLVKYIEEEIEETFFDEKPMQTAELDKAWDAIHRAFCDSELSFINGEYPLNLIILGGEVLYGDKEDEDDYIVSLKNASEVQEIFQALTKLSENDFSVKYFKVDEVKYGVPLNKEDFEYTWSLLQSTIPFWQYATENKLSVIFTVDQ